jgi:hypothetical protein
MASNTQPSGATGGVSIISYLQKQRDGVVFAESFENPNFIAAEGWTISQGSPANSSSKALPGSNGISSWDNTAGNQSIPVAYKTITDTNQVAPSFSANPGSPTWDAQVWFYDDGTTTAGTGPYFKIKDSLGNYFQVGAYNPTSSTYYSTGTGKTQNDLTYETSVLRTVGWHKFVISSIPGSQGVAVSIDGTAVNYYLISSYTGVVTTLYLCAAVIGGGASSSFGYFDNLALFRDQYAYSIGKSAPVLSNYLMPAFGYSTATQQLFMYQSNDGVTWTALTPGPVYSGDTPPNFRDPSIILYNNVYYCVYTPINTAGGSFNVCPNFGLASSPDLITWTSIGRIDCSSIGTPSSLSVWAPSFFQDTNGNIYISVAVTTTGGDTGFIIYNLNFTGGTTITNTSWSNPSAITGSMPSNCIDPFILKIGSTYYMFYKNETTKYVEYATATAPGGPYTVIGSGNWASWGTGLEAPSVVQLTNGNYRVYMDQYANQGIWYSDTSNLFGSMTAKSKITTPAFPGQSSSVAVAGLSVMATPALTPVVTPPTVPSTPGVAQGTIYNSSWTPYPIFTISGGIMVSIDSGSQVFPAPSYVMVGQNASYTANPVTGYLIYNSSTPLSYVSPLMQLNPGDIYQLQTINFGRKVTTYDPFIKELQSVSQSTAGVRETNNYGLKGTISFSTRSLAGWAWKEAADNFFFNAVQGNPFGLMVDNVSDNAFGVIGTSAFGGNSNSVNILPSVVGTSANTTSQFTVGNYYYVRNNANTNKQMVQVTAITTSSQTLTFDKQLNFNVAPYDYVYSLQYYPFLEVTGDTQSGFKCTDTQIPRWTWTQACVDYNNG